MSDREKELVEKISRLPDNLQERFLYQAQGAALAVEALNDAEAEKADADKSA